MPTINTASTARSTPTARNKATGTTTGATNTDAGSAPAAKKGTGAGRPKGLPNDGPSLNWTAEQRKALVLARTNGHDSATSLATALKADPQFADVTDLLTPERVRTQVQRLVTKFRKAGKTAAAARLSLGRGAGSGQLDELESILTGGVTNEVGTFQNGGSVTGLDGDGGDLDGEEVEEV